MKHLEPAEAHVFLQTHPEAVRFGGACDFASYKEQDLAMLAVCDELVVLMLPGWRDSVGVAAEIAAAEELNMPITYMRLV